VNIAGDTLTAAAVRHDVSMERLQLSLDVLVEHWPKRVRRSSPSAVGIWHGMDGEL
jgi:hypothetical protein